jgi:hypothetical protein
MDGLLHAPGPLYTRYPLDGRMCRLQIPSGLAWKQAVISRSPARGLVTTPVQRILVLYFVRPWGAVILSLLGYAVH